MIWWGIMMMEFKYYIVMVKCGHVGRDKFMPIRFAIKARNKKEAAALAREKPRVKRGHKDAILSVEEVDKTKYLSQIFYNRCDPYLSVCSKHEQNKIMPLIVDRLEEDMHHKRIIKETKKTNVKHKLKKNFILINQKNLEIKEFMFGG